MPRPGQSLFFASPMVTPSSILGGKLKLDLDADRVQLGIGTRVTTWPDQSTSDNAPSQATMAAQPTQVQSVLDGHAALRFTGSHWLRRAAGAFAGFAAGDAPRMYVVASAADQCVTCSIGTSAVANNGMYINRYNTNWATLAAVGSANYAWSSAPAVTNGAMALIDGRINAGNTVTVAINGTDRGTVAGSAAPAGLRAAVDRLYVGTLEDEVSQRLTGDIVRIVIANPAPSSPEHDSLLAFFKQSYPSLGIP